MTHWTRMSASVILIALTCLAAGCDEPAAIDSAGTPEWNDDGVLACTGCGHVYHISREEPRRFDAMGEPHPPRRPDGTCRTLTDDATDLLDDAEFPQQEDYVWDWNDPPDIPSGGTFVIIGGVLNPGTYERNRADMRLMDCIARARGVLTPTITYLYVIRDSQDTPDNADAARLIAINLPRLYDGDPTQNILIQPDDIIRVPDLDYGEFEIRGRVNRPGVYSLSGLEITLKMAYAAAGMAHDHGGETGTVTRIGADGQEQVIAFDLERIFTGQDEDIPLQDGDVIVVY
jgi:protein involved in polysaccharide export with SLBB domain